MEEYRIGVISDTHGLLRPEVEEVLRTCEAIFHAGDMDTPEVLERLKTIAPVYAVRGNADRNWGKNGAGGGQEAENLPEELDITVWGFRFYLVHNQKDLRKDLREMDAVVYGHSHKYEDIYDEKSGIRYLNPGSCGPKRFRLPVTMLLLTLHRPEHSMEVKKVDFTRALAAGTKQEAGKSTELFSSGQKTDMGTAGARGELAAQMLQEKDLHRLVKTVMKEVKAGRSTWEIAARNHAEEKLVEDICRMYVTHPGVDAEGIMDRLERRGM